MTIKLGDVSLFKSNSYVLKARFNSVNGLRQGSSVEMLGIEIGKVKKFTMNQDDQFAHMDMEIQKGIKVYDDAHSLNKQAALHRRPGI